MLSVVMPYWNRNRALNRTLASYKYTDIEVIIVDDGSPEKADPIRCDFPIRVIRLQDKSEPKNPCVPINIGVSEAKGSHICITNPEIWHQEPVLDKMIADHYVLAACWDVPREKWFCHSSVTHMTPMPEGFGLHFCGVLPKSQFVPFDESYRGGCGYDDNDWAWALHSKGVQCEIRDDLVVLHEQDHRTAWRMKSNRNKFYKKWNLS